MCFVCDKMVRGLYIYIYISGGGLVGRVTWVLCPKKSKLLSVCLLCVHTYLFIRLC